VAATTWSRNLVEDHESYGIAVMPNLDANLWPTAGNEVRGNVVRASGRADLALGAPAAGDDCFAGNDWRRAPARDRTAEGMWLAARVDRGSDAAPP
jgi:hypothetical protein